MTFPAIKDVTIRHCRGNKRAWIIDDGSGLMLGGYTSLTLEPLITKAIHDRPGARIIIDPAPH